ncbi:hypothetical protein ACBR40_33410 [Nonomuraea sp. AD125B]|uniref:hypothetical protein n=1 Tax=Nonomuraea sp. AD125B TaxID=3242897 RepID=UPI00352734A5
MEIVVMLHPIRLRVDDQMILGLLRRPITRCRGEDLDCQQRVEQGFELRLIEVGWGGPLVVLRVERRRIPVPVEGLQELGMSLSPVLPGLNRR